MSTLLSILLAFTTASLDEAQSKQGENGRIKKSKSAYKVVVDRNIFAPYKAKRTTRPTRRTTPKRTTPRRKTPPAPWMITGVYYHEKTDIYKLIVEKSSRSGSSLKVLVKDDVFEGVKVTEITPGKITFLVGEKAVECKVGDKAPQVKPKEPEKTEGKTGNTEDKGDKEDTAEKTEEKTEEKADKGGKKDYRDVLERLRNKRKKKPLPDNPDDN